MSEVAKSSIAADLVVSVALLIPCVWQERIQAIDLPSHVYNAWLANLIARGQAAGLWIQHQWNNVLFDWMLAWLLPRVGASAAQRIAVGAAVLVFAWGAMFLIGHGGRRNRWLALPCAGVLAYGFIFQAGFFNFYLGLGICFWYLALFLSGGARTRLLAMPLLLVAWLAHPMPVVWVVGLAAYVMIAERIPPRVRWVILAAGAVVLLAAHFLIQLRYPYTWSIGQAWQVTGAPQVLLFSAKYDLPYGLLLAAWLMLLWRLARKQGRRLLADLRFQMWALTAVAVTVIPSAITFPQYALAFSFISLRFSLAAGVLLCGLLNEVELRVPEKALLMMCVVSYFGLLFADGRMLNRVEDRLDAVVGQLPTNTRVIGRLRSITMPIQLLHAVDRACLGYCYSYANYEPASRQFRVRAAAGNPIVMADYHDVSAVERGDYRVQARDLPLFLVYLCGAEVCARELREGEVVGGAEAAGK
ncbi:MAG TPA: hypothetical protein VF753_12690 [Terriglobales bacterium]